MSKESNTSSGIGITGLLFVAFIILKIVGVEPVAHWSWWWVTCPLWGPLAFWAGIVLIGVTLKAFSRIF